MFGNEKLSPSLMSYFFLYPKSQSRLVFGCICSNDKGCDVVVVMSKRQEWQWFNKYHYAVLNLWSSSGQGLKWSLNFF